MTTSDSSAPGKAVLVAGGRGFVGSHVTRALLNAGYEPVLFGPAMAEDRLSDIRDRIGEISGSVEDRDALAEAFRQVRPAFVVSCIAHGVGTIGLMRSGEAEGDAALAVNVAGFGKLLDAAREAGVRRVVWTSSTVVYGPASLYGDRKVDEADRLAPTTFYGLTKELAESVAAYHARRHGLDVVGLRLPLILGPGLWYQGAASALAQMFEAARAGRDARVSFHDAPIDLMHAADVAEAVLTALNHQIALDLVYNLKAVEVGMPGLIVEIERRKPGVRILLDRIEPPLLFPLVSGARFKAATGFTAKHDLSGLVQAHLNPGAEAMHD